jgi:DNA-binding NtrC family response regulator
VRAIPSILVVEDEVRMREMLLRAVQEMGFAASGVGTAELALKALDQPDAPQIILMDLNLPGMDGLEFMQRARARCPQAAMIVLTGFGSLEAAKMAIRYDAVDFLTKPCRLDELETALARAQLRIRSAAPLPAAIEHVAETPNVFTTDGIGTLEDVEREQILAALERHDGNRAATATELGISERTLYYRLARYSRR